MVATRSQKKKVKSAKKESISDDDGYESSDSLAQEDDESEELDTTEEGKEIVVHKKNPKKKFKSIQIQFISDREKHHKRASDKSDEEEDDESPISENDPEDDYLDLISSDLLHDDDSLAKIKKIIADIEKDTPTIRKLLDTKMRKKHRADLFEWILIYENAMPLSEEKKMLRKQIQAMMETYTKEYSQYKSHKKELRAFEKKFKNYNEHFEIQYKILNLETHNANKEAIYRKYIELMDKMDEMDDDYYKLKSWITCALNLPFDKIKKFPTYLSVSEYLVRIKNIFDEELYGMSKVKEQLLLFIHSKLINPDVKGSCLGLIGEPGVGKTSIARCLAKVLEFPFEQITFGGVNSADFIRGFDYTYVGSRPGEIVRCLTRMQYKNGIIFFDEYEKISQNKDIVSCLLHLTDFTQNNTFRDNYLNDLVIDLSSIWFIYSMNAAPEDEALKDRIFYIHIEGYKEFEKIRILKDYLLPKHIKNLNLPPESIQLDEQVSKFIVNKISPEDKGIRNLERALKDIINKTSFLVSNQKTIQCSFALPEKYYPFEYPVKLNVEMIDVFLRNFFPTKDRNHLSMYC